MTYVFNEQEQAQIEAARLKAPVGDNADAVGVSGNWVDFYTTLSNILEKHLAAGNLDSTDRTNFKNAKLWLDVAIGANAGVGMHSAFIRSFTDRQGELRRGSAFSTAEMQKASNGVALNLYRGIKGLDEIPGMAPWTIPSIDQIARADASSIGRNLFGEGSAQPLAEGDDAVVSNSAWSGTLGFSLLGGSAPFETWRLLRDRARNDAEGQGSLDSLDDFKNILYALDSYAKGLAAGATQGGKDFINYLAASQHFAMTGEWPSDNAGPLAAQVAIMVNSGNLPGLVKDVAARTPVISPVVNAIVDVGPHKFLDMLMGAVQGKSLIGTTKTDAEFATNAKAFLGALTPQALQTLRAELLPLSAAKLSEWALQDTPEGASVRAALAGLSVVAVQVSEEVAQRVSLRNDATGQGRLTREWVEGRAAFTAAFFEQQQRGGGIVPGNRNLRYFDAATGTQVLVGAGSEQREQFVFGGEGADTLEGQGFADRLFGGAGEDALSGRGGADRLEGGEGSDVLDGGAGYDTLVGGDGNDTYVFTGDFGNDTVLDSDGQGRILLGTQTLSGGTKVSDNVWESKDKAVVYTLRGSDLIIGRRTADGAATVQGTIRVLNWKPGELGLDLADAAPETAPAQPSRIYDLGSDAGLQDYVRSQPQDSVQSLWVRNAATAHDVGVPGASLWRSTSATGGQANDMIEGGTEQAVSNIVLAGGAGDDRLYAGVNVALKDAIARGDDAQVVVLATSHIVLDGGTGDDTLVGGDARDVLFGGAGDDTIVGGAGGDLIFADGNVGGAAGR